MTAYVYGATRRQERTSPVTARVEQLEEMEQALQPGRPVLSDRELQVLQGIADGRSNAEIGRSLWISEDTVKTHSRMLYARLGARDRAHAVAIGYRWGFLAPAGAVAGLAAEVERARQVIAECDAEARRVDGADPNWPSLAGRLRRELARLERHASRVVAS